MGTHTHDPPRSARGGYYSSRVDGADSNHSSTSQMNCMVQQMIEARLEKKRSMKQMLNALRRSVVPLTLKHALGDTIQVRVQFPPSLPGSSAARWTPSVMLR